MMASRLPYESKFQGFTRLGFVARGLLYIIIAWLVLRTGRTEDLTGALEYVGRGTGRILLIALAAGLAVYGLWRLGDAASGMESGHGQWKTIGKRTAAGIIGIIYLYLAYKAVSVLLVGSAEAGDARDHARTVLDLPGGELVLGFAALVFLVAGAAQLRKSWSCSFLRRLDEGAGQQTWIKWLGRIGYAARGIVFLVVAFLIGRAAVDSQADEAGSLEQALDFFASPMDKWIAAGLLLFGLFSLIEARFRRIQRPPVEEVERQVTEKVTG